ncbi:uridine kinase [Micrococcus sp.]|uniref:uridine kinase family protein n=1 Tax=Micrococcus sp. TaxID=1271 RepID=UPI002A90C97A|nr:uridine kinase [Micrococcus sp.]MDY6054638.1 uridine kinase [Micrococcus sp.]
MTAPSSSPESAPVPEPADAAPVPPRVVLLGGASGAGKSYLARRHGRPHFPLDAYYREIGEDPEHGGPGPAMPRTPYGEIDWDHHLTWDEQAAVDGIVELLETGSTLVPEYSITTSSRTGARLVSLEGDGPIVAEGIFAHRMPAALTRAGVPFTALYIDSARTVTAVRRFGRDVAERRKPVPFLLRRGWALYRSDAADRARAVAAGFVPTPKRTIRHLLGPTRG